MIDKSGVFFCRTFSHVIFRLLIDTMTEQRKKAMENLAPKRRKKGKQKPWLLMRKFGIGFVKHQKIVLILFVIMYCTDSIVLY